MSSFDQRGSAESQDERIITMLHHLSSMYGGAAKSSLDASGAKTGDTIEMQVEPRQLPYETNRDPYLIKGILMEANAFSDGNAKSCLPNPARTSF